jgi:sirohydrochlorin cobaltochelatase
MEFMKAVIFFGHGARDVRWREPFDRLCNMWQNQYPDVLVELAFLEMMQPNLPTAIDSLRGQGAKEIEIIPVFFGQGGHLREDFPKLLSEAQKQFPHIQLRAASAVGEDESVLRAIVDFTARTLR